MDKGLRVIEQLRDQNRLLKVLCLVATSALACFILTALRSPESMQNVTTAQTYRILDKDGNSRMQISTDSDGTPCLLLTDKDKTSRIRFLVSDKNTPIINLLSGDGTLVWYAPRPKND